MNLRAIEPEDLTDLIANAKADAHPVILPTHVVIDRGGKLVGYMMLAAVQSRVTRGAVVNIWLDSQSVKAGDTLALFRTLQTELREQGYTQLMIVCAPESPFYTHLERLGFSRLGSSTFNLKAI
jgi:L-amino acid N-acyltransferase YncA